MSVREGKMNSQQIQIFATIMVSTFILFLVYLLIRKQQGSNNEKEHLLKPTHNNKHAFSEDTTHSIIKFEELSREIQISKNDLIEINDEKLIARVTNLVPEVVTIMNNVDSVNKINKTIKSAGSFYQAIIPKGADLDKSRSMTGAVRGSFRVGKSRIKGNASWVNSDGVVSKLAEANITNTAMGIASLVVGQYYMTQINDELDKINESLSKISDFQDNEYQSKVYSIVAHVEKISTFQVEIIENEENRKEELRVLSSLERLCIELLGQANITLEGFSRKNNLKYKSYEKAISEIEKWVQYHRLLLQLLLKIGDLVFTLNLGGKSTGNCYAFYQMYSKQSESTRVSLLDWHLKTWDRLDINLDESNRRRLGIDGLLLDRKSVV